MSSQYKSIYRRAPLCGGPVLVVAAGGVLVAKHTFDKMRAHLECDRRGGYTTPQTPTACRYTSNVAQ